MMSHEIICRIQEGYQIVAEDQAGHCLFMDLSEKNGGKDSGFLPMPVLLASLGGCLSVDVKIVLERMHCQVENVELRLQGEIDEDASPRVYKKILLSLFVKGNATREQLERALSISEEKLCNVSAMLKQVIPMEFKIQEVLF